jgi:hypothetical protein
MQQPKNLIFSSTRFGCLSIRFLSVHIFFCSDVNKGCSKSIGRWGYFGITFLSTHLNKNIKHSGTVFFHKKPFYKQRVVYNVANT